MRPTINRAGRVGGGVALILALLAALVAEGAVLFPQPLHIVRSLSDPISGSATTIEEYCVGNRVISLSGDRVTIADYERQELTEIDRAALTYSVTSFPDIARANAPSTGRRPLAAASSATRKPLAAKSLGVRRSAAGRSIEMYAIGEASETSVTVGIDRNVSLSREAAEVLAGAAYPNAPAPHHEALIRAAAHDNAYGLAAEQSMQIEAAGDRITVTNTVTRITNELPPPDLTAIPTGARRVESRITAIPRLLDDLEKPANQLQPRP